MLIHFKMDQTLARLAQLNSLKEYYDGHKFYNKDKPNYSFDLLDITTYTLARIKLVPNRIAAGKNCNQPCVDFIYNIDNVTKLYIGFQPDYYFSYKIEKEDRYALSKYNNYEGKTLIQWIDILVGDLLIKTIQEYEC